MSQQPHQTVRLSEVVDFVRGITFTPADVLTPDAPGAVVCMRTKNVQADLDQDDLLAVPPEFVRGEAKYLREGDVLLSTANSYDLVGKSCWVPRLTYPATAGGFIAIFRAKRDRLDSRYFYWWMVNDHTRGLLRRCGRRTTNISNMDMNRAATLEIPLRPLAEQRRVAAVQDRADALRIKHQQSVDELELLSSSLITGGHSRSRGLDPERAIEEIAEINPRPTAALRTARDMPVSFLPMAAVSEDGEIIDEQERDISEVIRGFTFFERGDVLIAKITPCFENGKGCLTTDLGHPVGFGTTEFHVLRASKEVRAEYLFGCLRTEGFKRYATARMTGTGGQLRVPSSAIARYEIPVPSGAEQDKLCDLLSRVRLVRKKHLRAVKLAVALRDCLASRFFGGVDDAL